MKPARVLATAERVLTQIRHDHRTLALLLLVPALLIGLVAWIFTDTPVFASIGPAMIALFPFIVMFLVTSIATLRERRSGTLERLLSLPLGKGEFILGYALAFGLLAVVQTGHRRGLCRVGVRAGGLRQTWDCSLPWRSPTPCWAPRWACWPAPLRARSSRWCSSCRC